MANDGEPVLPPLPSAVHDAVQAALGRTGTLAPPANPGLVFERYPRCWKRRADDWALDEGRQKFLLDFAEGYERLRDVYEPLLGARIRALDAAFRGRLLHASWRFVSGVGAAHPVENGFTFHRLLGVPFFAGSTVKGLARAAARLLGVDDEEMRRYFGPEVSEAGEPRPAGTGSVIFLDALPVAWPRLGVDLVNNHRPTWTASLNSGAGELGAAERASAAGLEDPVPVSLLVVEPGVEYRFWIAPRPGSRIGESELDQVWEWLETGLRYLGIGAKTAVGYGRFRSGTPPPRPRSPSTADVGRGRPSLKKGDHVRFVLTGQSRKGHWQGHLAETPQSFGTLLGEPPPGAAVGQTHEVVVGVAADFMRLNLRWP